MFGKKYIIIKGTAYLKNGKVIKEKVKIEKETNDTIKEIDNKITLMRDEIKKCFQNNESFQISFGGTLFRGDDLSAFTVNVNK